VEVQSTIGVSSEAAGLAATQIRAIGDFSPTWRYYGEAGIGCRPGASSTYDPSNLESASDSFGAAYPYNGRPTLLEAYAERSFAAGKAEQYYGTVRLGQFRPPFGIYSESDHAYIGFTRAPLIRYYTNWALSNFWIDAGADALISSPHLQLEASSGVPRDAEGRRRSNGDLVARIQAYQGPLILGVSHIVTDPPADEPFATGRSQFTGLDFRLTYAGLQVRGEWLAGRQISDTYTQGWYVDAIAHEPSLERITWVARYEELRYSAGTHSANLSRRTLGGKLLLTRHLTSQLNLIQHSAIAASNDRAVDVTFTYSFRV